MSKVAAISINTSWNIVNFRLGLIRRLKEDGYEIVAIAPVDAYSSRFSELGVHFEPIKIDSKGSSPLRDLALMLTYLSIFRRIKPTVYLAYTAKPNIYGSVAAQMLNIPVINNISGLGTAFIAGGWLGRIVSGLYRLSLRHSRTVFFQNDEDRALFVQKRLVQERQARLLPGSGIDLIHFAPRETPPLAGCFTFLLPARLLWDKGIGEFVAAARMLRGEGLPVKFQLLGFLDVENRTAVNRSDVEAWVSEGVIDYLGATDDVRSYLAAADCVVLPSYREGLPRSLLEAAAMERPLIASDVPGCRDIVRDGVNGFCCNARNAPSLAGAMRHVMRLTLEQRLELGRAGRRLALAEFDEAFVIERYRAAIARALNGEQTVSVETECATKRSSENAW